jgi:hypothetical protein
MSSKSKPSRIVSRPWPGMPGIDRSTPTITSASPNKFLMKIAGQRISGGWPARKRRSSTKCRDGKRTITAPISARLTKNSSRNKPIASSTDPLQHDVRN